MNSLINILEKYDKFNNYIKDVKQGVNPIMLSGLTDSGKVHLSFATQMYAEKPICIITYNELQARRLIKDLKYYTDKVYYFPKREIVTYDYLAESKDLLNERIEALSNMVTGNAKIVVTTIEATMQKTVAKETLFKHILNIQVGKEYKLEQVKENLIKLGYERFDLVEGKGQFSVRGGIVDIAITEKEGIRIEFWGDEVDSIRNFNIYTQRSTDMLQNVEIYPANEFVLEKGLDKICYDIQNGDYLEEDLEEIRNGNYLNKIDKYFNSFYQNQSTFIDYLSDEYIICIDEVKKAKQRAENIIKDNESIMKSLVEKGKKIPEALQVLDNYDQIMSRIEKTQTIYLENQDVGFVDMKSMLAKRNGYSFSYREVNFFRSSMDLLLEEIQKSVESNKTIIIACGNLENIKKTKDLLKNSEESLLNESNLIFTQGNLSTGFECYDFNLIVISVTEVFSTPKKRRKLSSDFKQGETVMFSELKVGDYIVHRINGIGQFSGVNTIKADGIVKDYIKIKYRDDDILYIPTNNLDSIRRYIGAGNRAPKVNRLGSKEWTNTKAKVKSNLKEVARDLIELYAKREKLKGYAFSKDMPWQKEFEDSFEFEETTDQLRAIDEMKKDMENDKPMDRLLCGDVGYGKTEVALRGAFKACMDQKQVAYLAPTTILANQQYEAFRDRMKEYPIRVEVLNRFRTKKEQTEIINKIKLGEIDVIVGTHRLLSKDVEFKNLGFLIIDEEHRFGVKDKEKIKQLKTNVDVLTMTATPIPRTLHMSMVGIRDMSCLYEPPQNRIPVQTYVLEYDEEVIKEAITKELEREGQVFYLYNNVESIERKKNRITELVPEAKVAFAHGKMSGAELEDIMLDFVNKRTDVLVCTTILESGIDIPNANTIIVENADRLGLAQLYQIRGRVGRSDKQAYAYVTYKKDKMLSEVAEKRLKAIKEFTEFGSGFKIAMRDLEIRGAGSLLGEMQHGHMDQVGYDTYCKLLDEVIKEYKGIETEEEKEITIDIDVSSYIPDSYIENNSQKIEVYQNIALASNEEDLKNVVDDISDRFGKIPKEVIGLIDIARIKILCRNLGINKVMQKNSSIVFTFEKNQFNMDINKLIEEYENNIKFSPAIEPYITLKISNKQNIIDEIKKFLKR